MIPIAVSRSLRTWRPAAVVLALAAGVASGPAAAQTASGSGYPNRPVRVLVPVTPGGGTDTVARLVSQKLAAALGQPFVVENRPGAGGNIAEDMLAKAPADGYTLIVVTASHATNPSLYKKLPFDAVKDFAPITQLSSQPYLVVVPQASPARNVQGLVAYARSKPGGLSYASSGAGLLGHLGMEQLKLSGGFEATHIPYKGAAPAMNDVLGGQVDAFLPTIISGGPQVRTGRIRALAVTSAKRSPLLPDVPTVAEQGFPGYEVSGWYGLLAPAGTPREVIRQLYEETARILAAPDVRASLASDGSEPVGSTPEQFAAYIQAEMRKWGEVVKKSGATAE